MHGSASGPVGRAAGLKPGEPVEIRTVLAELAIDALDERVLRQLAGLDEVPLHASLLRPEEHRLAGQLGTVVADNLVWQRATLRNPVKLARQP